MSPFWLFTGLVTLLLQASVLLRLCKRGAYRSYPFLFAYVVAVLFSGLLDWATVLNVPLHPTAGEQYRNYYWSSDAVHQFLCFNIMLSLIFRAMQGVARRWLLIAVIFTALVIVTVASVYWSQSGQVTYSTLMTIVARNLSFCSALLNMVLWSAILRHGVANMQLLLVSAGLGLQTTGKATGHALRLMARMTVVTGDLIIVATHILCLAIWLWAFRKVPERKRAQPAGISSPIAPNL